MKLLSIMILWIRLGYAQVNCLNDIPRQSTYYFMSVLNPQSGEYEKYSKTKYTALEVTIISESKLIKFSDKINNFDKTFMIKGCLMSDSTLSYECVDADNKRNCSLTFGSTNISYDLTVVYQIAPIVYKVSRVKNTN